MSSPAQNDGMLLSGGYRAGPASLRHLGMWTYIYMLAFMAPLPGMFRS